VGRRRITSQAKFASVYEPTVHLHQGKEIESHPNYPVIENEEERTSTTTASATDAEQ
jgi:hypothetical protein